MLGFELRRLLLLTVGVSRGSSFDARGNMQYLLGLWLGAGASVDVLIAGIEVKWTTSRLKLVGAVGRIGAKVWFVTTPCVGAGVHAIAGEASSGEEEGQMQLSSSSHLLMVL